MEAIEFVLVVMACVIVSSVIGKVTRRLALPLVQIAVGVVVALLVPAVGNVQISSESFLLLFIAPLLFNEARESKRVLLFTNKGAILSLAVGLVVVSVVAVGGALWAMVPFLPLAAAFACAAALAPTDAAAVGAMGSTVDLRGRQETLLSGESLINDASGVVAFQFAIAAALTGEFSAAAAGQEFLVLFVGGLVVGLAAGFVIWGAMAVLRHFGYEDTTLHVLFEVTAPFAVYLLAEWLHVSGILAVVAAGIVMTNRAPRLVSADAARRQMVSNNFWKIIVFTINGIVFTLLGMELPRAFDPAITAYFPVPALLAVVVAATLLIYACRLAWIWVMELVHRDRVTGERGVRRPKEAFHDALVMTLAGAKGAVTLSIIFTIPLPLADGSPFPGRSLILLITAAVILCTLLCANFILPLLAPKELASDDEAVQRATIQVLERTLAQLRAGVAENAASEYTRRPCASPPCGTRPGSTASASSSPSAALWWRSCPTRCSSCSRSVPTSFRWGRRTGSRRPRPLPTSSPCAGSGSPWVTKGRRPRWGHASAPCATRRVWCWPACATMPWTTTSTSAFTTTRASSPSSWSTPPSPTCATWRSSATVARPRPGCSSTATRRR